MTKAEKARAARSCPKCGAEQGRPCRKNRRRAVPGYRGLTPGTPMKGVHAERMGGPL